MKVTDKKGRNIFLEHNGCTIDAYHEGKKVGFIQFNVVEYSTSYVQSKYIAYPEQMHIDVKYQRSGIGVKIIEHAKEIYDDVKFAEDTGCGGNTNEIHYTPEGLRFKNYCETNGIV